ncbi:succinylglutamate desuccinylase/aspartoacylase family protein [Polaromonas sp. P1(28)-13]|nr:succinylglutamate desuccinylase/aspartoacylase family protein [Polaromonas sp. P1(28)-13]
MKRELCEAAQLQASSAKSVKGQTIWVRDVKPDHAGLRVLVVGAIHGDELSSAAVALHWIKQATQTPLDAPQRIHWRFVPMLNPDGVLNRPPSRVNANGVDLNLQFPHTQLGAGCQNLLGKADRQRPAQVSRRQAAVRARITVFA